MKNSQALAPTLLSNSSNKLLLESLNLLFGVVLMSVLSHLKIYLPNSVVPLTGQTFGVFLLALNFGFARSAACMGLYLLLGFAGLPLFASNVAGAFTWGATSGYLVGMLAATLVMAYLADRGWGKSWLKCFASVTIGNILIYAFGLAVLNQFVPSEMLLSHGLIPFIPGMLIKSFAAILITVNANRVV